MDIWQEYDGYIETKIDHSIEELSQLCAIPSIAAQNTGLKEAADAVGNMLEARGFTVSIMPTDGAPVVIAERKGVVDKTLMFYNHYDVQPAEPLELWDSPPFEATLKDGKLIARGVSDDKGHITSRLHAIDAILAVDGELPCNIKFVIEGEEEVGSVHLPAFISDNKDLLSADACIWEFGGVNHEGAPVQTLGMRGICYVELSVKTADIDAHSGLGGSIFPNAAWRLTWALNTLKDENEVIKIPGIYDSVVPPSDRDLELLEKLPDVMEEYRYRYGVQTFLNDIDDELILKTKEVFEPTCTICGLTSGYQGDGSKTVLPAEAKAKVDFRLVPNQTPEEVVSLLRKHLDDQGFDDIEIAFLGGGPAGRTDPDHPFIHLVNEAAKTVYDKPVVIRPMIGGSGPNHAFIHQLNLPIATSGVGYPGTQAHAPNENILIDLYILGAKHILRIMKNFATS